MRAKTGFLTSEPRAWARWAGSGKLLGWARACLPNAEHWAKMGVISVSQTRLYCQSSLQTKRTSSIKFEPKNEINRLFGILPKWATKTKADVGFESASFRFMFHLFFVHSPEAQTAHVRTRL